MTANGIQIEYDTFGDPSFPALLLIAGNGAQILFWDVEFCGLLAQKGYFVLRFDNRDSGLSTKFEEAGIPDFSAAIQALMQGKPVESAYSLDDMADDAVGLLDALGIAKAHICGASMGGMIAHRVSASPTRPESHFHHVDHRKSRSSAGKTGNDRSCSRACTG